MSSPMPRWAIVAAALLLGGPVVSRAGDKPSCAKVISAVNRNIGHRDGAPAGAAAVAKQLGSDIAWVERCMAAYGRIPAARHRKTTDYERDRVDDQVELGEVWGDEDGDDTDWDEAVVEVPDKEPREKHPKLAPSRQPLAIDKEFLHDPEDKDYWRE